MPSRRLRRLDTPLALFFCSSKDAGIRLGGSDLLASQIVMVGLNLGAAFRRIFPKWVTILLHVPRFMMKFIDI